MPVFAKLITSAPGTVSPSSIMILSSAGLLIVVAVMLDTMRQLESQLLMRHYEGFIK
jgi:preprotein translocase subunit SecY